MSWSEASSGLGTTLCIPWAVRNKKAFDKNIALKWRRDNELIALLMITLIAVVSF